MGNNSDSSWLLWVFKHDSWPTLSHQLLLLALLSPSYYHHHYFYDNYLGENIMLMVMNELSKKKVLFLEIPKSTSLSFQKKSVMTEYILVAYHLFFFQINIFTWNFYSKCVFIFVILDFSSSICKNCQMPLFYQVDNSFLKTYIIAIYINILNNEYFCKLWLMTHYL